MMKRAVALFFSHSNALQGSPKLLLLLLLLLFNHGYNITCESVTWVNTEAIVVTRQKPRKTILLTSYYVDGVKSTICSMMGFNLTWVSILRWKWFHLSRTQIRTDLSSENASRTVVINSVSCYQVLQGRNLIWLQ